MNPRQARTGMRLFMWLVSAVLFSLIPILVWVFLTHNIPHNSKVEPEIVNGILTISAIILGFSSFYAWPPRELGYRFTLHVIFVLEVAVLAFTGFSYFKDFLDYQYVSAKTLLAATISLMFNLASWLTTSSYKSYLEMKTDEHEVR